ncbi:MarR family winged helix-turn-helix transcriptional regulator [Curtobacterium sp. ISL-83]|uniref:MarR family winged helix-turn-helix transcriptional regulator n=1 Tax=Curtobacterium sp. ISL-83 TaxID=2819145 RepID=UPI001BEC99F3|nr:MarR family winged helix-turn-helix transcriptional regulator [Curtobacterium sp. ISL-83]MBT2504130.1 winged helix-turn-helix transcriptional regulator [Curtobacterium sp. ISL-83]
MAESGAAMVAPERTASPKVDRIEQQFAAFFDGYRQRLRQQAAQLDPALQPSGYRTLFELVIGGPVGAGALAERLGFDKSVLSRQLHQLDDLGFVSREPDPSDRRAVVISATPDAVVRINQMRTDARDAFRGELSGWPEQDLDDLSRLLAKLAVLNDGAR